MVAKYMSLNNLKGRKVYFGSNVSVLLLWNCGSTVQYGGRVGEGGLFTSWWLGSKGKKRKDQVVYI
jgi:hypothetical protein